MHTAMVVGRFVQLNCRKTGCFIGKKINNEICEQYRTPYATVENGFLPLIGYTLPLRFEVKTSNNHSCMHELIDWCLTSSEQFFGYIQDDIDFLDFGKGMCTFFQYGPMLTFGQQCQPYYMSDALKWEYGNRKTEIDALLDMD
jgi:hypothetical protein